MKQFNKPIAKVPRTKYSNYLVTIGCDVLRMTQCHMRFTSSSREKKMMKRRDWGSSLAWTGYRKNRMLIAIPTVYILYYAVDRKS